MFHFIFHNRYLLKNFLYSNIVILKLELFNIFSRIVESVKTDYTKFLNGKVYSKISI